MYWPVEMQEPASRRDPLLVPPGRTGGAVVDGVRVALGVRLRDAPLLQLAVPVGVRVAELDAATAVDLGTEW